MTTFLLSNKLKRLIKKVVSEQNLTNPKDVFMFLIDNEQFIKEQSHFFAIYNNIEDSNTIFQDEVEDEIKRHLLEKFG